MTDDQEQPCSNSIAADGWYCQVVAPGHACGLVCAAPLSNYDYVRDFFLELEQDYFADAVVRLDRSAQSGKIDTQLASQLADIVRFGMQGQVPHSWHPGEGWFGEGIRRYPYMRREIGAVAYWRAIQLGYFKDPQAKQKICRAFRISRKTFEDDWHPKYRLLSERYVEAILLLDPSILNANPQKTFERYLLDTATGRSRRLPPPGK